MSNGLRDQLLKAGLVNEKQAKKAQLEKRKDDKQGKSQTVSVEEQAKRQKAAAEKAERDRQLNQQRLEQQERKALLAQIQQLVDAHKQSPGEGEFAYSFTDAGLVKRLYVSDSVRGRIARGALGIVKSGGRYELVPRDIAERIRERNAEALVLLCDTDTSADNTDAADPYAQYQVPDDLMW